MEAVGESRRRTALARLWLSVDTAAGLKSIFPRRGRRCKRESYGGESSCLPDAEGSTESDVG